MRLIVILGAVFALPQAGVAQIGACPSIADPAARLACYDKAAAALPATARPVARAAVPAIDGAKDVDPVGEQAVNAKMKNICSGC